MNRKKLKFPEVGERIKQLRGQRSQATMADELNVPLRSYHRYESGERLPPAEVMSRIAAKNGTTIDWIMAGIEPEEGDGCAEGHYRARLIEDFADKIEGSLRRERKWIETNNFSGAEDTASYLDWWLFLSKLREHLGTEEGKVAPMWDSAEDLTVVLMKSWLSEFWRTASEDERIWCKVQFGKCFPQYIEWSEKQPKPPRKHPLEGEEI